MNIPTQRALRALKEECMEVCRGCDKLCPPLELMHGWLCDECKEKNVTKRIVDTSESQLAEIPAQQLATVPASPKTILQQAIAAKLDPASMKDFYELYRKMEADAARAEYASAMASFRDECPLVSKSKTAKIVTKSGANFSFTYSPIEEVAATIDPILGRHRLSYRFDDQSTDKQAVVVCYVLHASGHEVASTGRCPIDMDAKMSPANATTAAWTTARRKAMMQAFGLVAADERDAEASRNDIAAGPKITANQAANIDHVIEEVGADRAKFLGWLGVDRIDEIPASRFGEVMGALEKKRKGGK